ncbi:MAG: hypothetical protein PVH65_16715, partial [Chloroflexota bacterium]
MTGRSTPGTAHTKLLILCAIVLALVIASVGSAAESLPLASNSPASARVPKWADGFNVPGVVGPVNALAADHYGHLYAGGSFAVAGRAVASNVAMWDGSKWSALGSGMNRDVFALAIDHGGNSNLYAGGYFTTAGGVSLNKVAMWDGSSWSALGSGIEGSVFALAVDSAGNLYAGGDIQSAGGVEVANIAKW